MRGSDAPTCPSCSGKDLERLLSTFGMASMDRTKELVKAERKRLTPIHQAEQREEFQKTLREHLEHET